MAAGRQAPTSAAREDLDPGSATAAAAQAPAARGERLVTLLDRWAARISSPLVFYPLLFLIDFVPSLLIIKLGLAMGASPKPGDTWVAPMLERDVFGTVMTAIVIGPLIENTIMWAIARGARALLRNADIAIILSAAVMAFTHMPAMVPHLISIFWGFAIFATVVLSRRLRYRFLSAWALHAAYNGLLTALLLALA